MEKPSEDEPIIPTPVSEQLERAEKWCEEILSPKTLDCLWYERLGEAAQSYSDIDSAISKFTKATECDNPSLNCFKSLAEAYYENDELLSACSLMEKALEMVNAAETPDQGELTSIYLRLAFWYNHLQQPERAIMHYQMVLKVDPSNQDALNGILTTSIESSPEQATHDLILEMSKLSSKEPGLYQLTSTILSQALDFSYGAPLRSLISICLSHQSCIDALREAIDQAIEAARKQDLKIELLVLLLHRGLASLYNDLQHSQSSSQAIDFWMDSYTITDQLIRKDDDEDNLKWRYQSFYDTIVNHLSFYYFEQTRKLPDSAESYLKLEELRRGFRFSGIEGITAADIFSAAFHTLRGDRTAAREAVKQYMRISIENLSDDTDENDYWAAYIQFKCLSACGDELNALTAWSLLEPIETDIVAKALNLDEGPQQWLIDEMALFIKTKCPLGATQFDRLNAVKAELKTQLAAASEEPDESENAHARVEEIQKALTVLESVQVPETNTTGDSSEEVPIAPLEEKDIAKKFGYTCDGTCGDKPLDFNNGLSICKYCWDVGFCDECLPLLKANKLKKIVCNPSHEWLAIPKWNPRGNAAVRDGIVQIGGELVDGVRVGGETVTVKEWLASLKKEWEI